MLTLTKLKPKKEMIKDNVQELLLELPNHVELVAATKNRTAQQLLQAQAAGIKIVGENYVQEAENKFRIIGNKVKWHFIGHLQKNKLNKAIKIFDMIETVDSQELAEEINRICARENKIMPVLIEVNSGREKQKSGVMPEVAEELIKELTCLNNIKIMGLMTMGPEFSNPEEVRPYFVQTKKLFDKISAFGFTGVEMKYLSMGMTNSYRIAIEEGANIVRVGTKIFGERDKSTT